MTTHFNSPRRIRGRQRLAPSSNDPAHLSYTMNASRSEGRRSCNTATTADPLTAVRQTQNLLLMIQIQIGRRLIQEQDPSTAPEPSCDQTL